MSSLHVSAPSRCLMFVEAATGGQSPAAPLIVCVAPLLCRQNHSVVETWSGSSTPVYAHNHKLTAVEQGKSFPLGERAVAQSGGHWLGGPGGNSESGPRGAWASHGDRAWEGWGQVSAPGQGRELPSTLGLALPPPISISVLPSQSPQTPGRRAWKPRSAGWRG